MSQGSLPPDAADQAAPDPAAENATNVAAPPSAEVVPPITPHAGMRYSLLRLLMLIAVGGVLYLVGLRDWLLLIAAFLISGIVSFFVFMRQRDAAAGNIEHQLHDWSEKRHPNDSAEA